ncbi:MAG: hypothetical protein LBR50_10600 [Tannerella sp.]|nr:hypothetical protein [Tannerella sp.]
MKIVNVCNAGSQLLRHDVSAVHKLGLRTPVIIKIFDLGNDALTFQVICNDIVTVDKLAATCYYKQA